MPVSISMYLQSRAGQLLLLMTEKISREVIASNAGVGGSALSLLLTSFKKY